MCSIQIRLFVPLILVAISGPAFAVDGVLEISQTCAVNTGCFAGDAAGFPVTISASGSYLLTSNLTVPDKNTGAILITSSGVGVDLNNFAISRSGCDGSIGTCLPSPGAGSGVEVASPGRNLSIENGTITGMGDYGVDGGGGSSMHVSNLRVFWNREGGLRVGGNSIVSGNIANQNGKFGIHASSSTVSGNTVNDNLNHGIFCSFCTISGNTVFLNVGDGINATAGSNVFDNTVFVDNVGGWGIHLLDSESAYRGNVITTQADPSGTVTGGVNAGGNVCDGSLTCP